MEKKAEYKINVPMRAQPEDAALQIVGQFLSMVASDFRNLRFMAILAGEDAPDYARMIANCQDYDPKIMVECVLAAADAWLAEGEA